MDFHLTLLGECAFINIYIAISFYIEILHFFCCIWIIIQIDGIIGWRLNGL
jgi:hypothetical protein